MLGRVTAIGTKTIASDRTIPLPDCVLPYIPKPISGPLFQTKVSNLGRNINRWLRRIGIKDNAKTLHSTRHRASYQLRKLNNDSLRHRCLGHEDNAKPSETYGGFDMATIANAFELIGL